MMTTHDGPGTGSEHPHSPGAPGTGGPRVDAADMRDLQRLRRTKGDRYVAGVAGGLARHFDVDPVVVRVALAVLTLFGGSGLLLYGALWILVPADDTDRAVVSLDERSRNVALFIAAGLAGLALLGDLVNGWVPWPLLLIGLAIALVVGNHQRRSEEKARAWASYAMPGVPTTPPGSSPYAGPPATSSSPYAGTPYAAAPASTSPYGPTSPYAAAPAGVPLTKDAGVPPVPPVPPAGPTGPTGPTGPMGAPYPPTAPVRRPRKPGPILFWFTLALASLGVGVLAVVDLAGADVAASAYPALALAIVAVMLVVGSFYGRPGGLILLGLALVPTTALALVGENLAGGELDVRPTQASALDDRYWLAGGETSIDLSGIRDVEELEGRYLTVESGAGRVEVILPEELDAIIRTDVGLGSVRLLDRTADGPGLSLNQTYDAPGTTPGVDELTALNLDVQVGLGDVVVVTR
ncbi:MAG TPA: PspC domain-containing protein [Nocardioides sp.]